MARLYIPGAAFFCNLTVWCRDAYYASPRQAVRQWLVDVMRWRRILCVSTAALLHSLRLFAGCRDVPLARLLRDARNAAGGRMAWFAPPDGETRRWHVSTSPVQHFSVI